MSALRYLPVSAVRLDDALTVVDCSLHSLELFDLEPESAGAAQLTEAIAEAADLADELALATARLVDAGSQETFEWRAGERRIEVTVAADGEGLFTAVLHDGTDARRVEHIQQEARGYLEQILADIPLGVAVLDDEMRITFINDAGRVLLGRLGAAAELVNVIGSSLVRLIPGQAGQVWQDLCSQARDECKRADAERSRFDEADALVIDAAAHPLHDRRERARGAILVLEDVTEQARLEDEVMRMERLATVGQVAITVNHEINNPLTIITTNAQAARLMNRDLDEKTVAKLQMIEAQVKRIADVTERLRTMEEVQSDEYIADGPKMIDIHGSRPEA